MTTLVFRLLRLDCVDKTVLPKLVQLLMTTCFRTGTSWRETCCLFARALGAA